MKKKLSISIGHLVKTVLAIVSMHACHAFGTQGTYMVVDLVSGTATYETGIPTDYTNDVYKTTKMVFRKVPAGTYALQNGTVQASMTNDYYVGIYEVTVGQYKLMQNPETTVPPTEANIKPKASISYNTLRGTLDAAVEPTATSPIGKLTSLVRAGGISGLFDLPTEAMWEIAARAMPANDTSHDTWPWFFGTSASALGDYAWYLGNAGGVSHVVGLKQPNDWGFYDMYGNVQEWCRDHWSWNNFVPTMTGNTTDAGFNRAQRGGSFESGGNDCSSGGRLNAYYTSNEAIYGFRLAMIPAVGAAAPLEQVSFDLDNDGLPDVFIELTGDGNDAGTITDNGNGSYDVTGMAAIELFDNGTSIGVIDVPTNVTVTVGADGTATLDAGETVTLTIDNGDGTTTVTTVNGPAEIAPDSTMTLGVGGSSSSVTTGGVLDSAQIEDAVNLTGPTQGIVFTTPGDGTLPGPIASNASITNDYPWTVDTTMSFYGSGSLKSGNAGIPNTSSTLEMSVDHGGTLEFYWKVSSEGGATIGENTWGDFLVLYIDGVEVDRITGERNWTRKTLELAPGPHTVKWIYFKDGTDASGNGSSDCGWVDSISWANIPGATDAEIGNAVGAGGEGDQEIAFTNDDECPWMIDSCNPAGSAPSARTPDWLCAGEQTTLSTIVTNGGTLAWSWAIDAGAGENSPAAVLAVLIDGEAVSSTTDATAWTNKTTRIIGEGEHVIEFVFRNDGDGDATGWIDNVRFTPSTTSDGGDDIGDVFTDGSDGDEPGEPLHWTSGGDASWFAQDIVVYDGTHAMQSGTVTNNFEASEWIATDIKGRGTLSWAWKTSCQPMDAQGFGAMCYLELSKDGVTEVLSRLTGETDWTVQSIDLDGEYSVRFVYQKARVTVTSHRDAAWVDSVKWVLDEDYKALDEAFGGNAEVSYDSESGSWVVSVTNDLTGPVVVPDIDAIEINLNGNTVAGPDGDAAGNAAAPNGLPAIVLEGTNTTLSLTGLGTISGGDGADETLGEDGHAAGNGASAIAVPDGFTGTVTAESGVTVTGGSGGNATNPESNPGTGAASGLTGDTSLAPGGRPAPAQLSGQVRITEWRPIDDTHWRLVFTTPASALKGRVENLEPNKSFSLKYSNGLPTFNQSGSGTNCGYANFTIDDASSAEGLITVTLTLTAANYGCGQSPSLFVKVVDPFGDD